MPSHPMAQTISPISPVTAPAYAAVVLRTGCTARPELLRAAKGNAMVTKLEDLNEYGKRAEDVALAIQKLAAIGQRREAMLIRLVSYYHLRDLIDLLRKHDCVQAPEVFAAATQVFNENRETMQDERMPVVILGQGATAKAFYEEDFSTRPSKAGPGAWARLRAFFGGSSNG